MGREAAVSHRSQRLEVCSFFPSPNSHCVVLHRFTPQVRAIIRHASTAQDANSNFVASSCHPAKCSAVFKLTATQIKRRNVAVNVFGVFVSKASRVATADLLSRGTSGSAKRATHDDR